MSGKSNRVLRPDGRYINVPLHRGQLFVCATGCCCGHVDRGFAPVPTDLYHHEWERRKLRNRIHLTQGGCLGPCPLANVATLFMDGQFTGFQGIDDPRLVVAVFDYIDALLAAEPDTHVPLPRLLQDRVFDYFTWTSLDAHDHPVPISAVTQPEQHEMRNPAILFLTHAATDLLIVNKIRSQLPLDFPSIQAFNLTQMEGEAEFQVLLAEHLPKVDVVLARIHGGRAGFRFGFDTLIEACRAQGCDLICVPGTVDLDPELTSVSTVPVSVIHDCHRYLMYGGQENILNLFYYLADNLLIGGYGYDLPAEQPRHGIYMRDKCLSLPEWLDGYYDPARPTAGILFYLAHWLSGNTRFVDALCDALEIRGFNVLPVFTYSLRERSPNKPERPVVFDYFYTAQNAALPDVVISTMSFALGQVTSGDITQAGWNVEALRQLNVPVIQAITSGMEQDQWSLSMRGLSPLDTAMNVAIPEFDGRIISVPISFKGQVHTPGSCTCCTAEHPVTEYVPVPDRIERAAGLAQRLVALQRVPNASKRIAIVLTNQPGKASRIGNAVGLDTPASLMHLFSVMQDAGYHLEHLPPDGDALIHSLIDRCAYDVEYLTEAQLAQAVGSASSTRYGEWFQRFPTRNQEQMLARWDSVENEVYFDRGTLKFAGLQPGNVLVALQPPRGYGVDPNVIYHTPDLPPTHHYAAFYRWLSEPQAAGGWGADAILHMGKHGTLEWLPGKGVGVSETCFPDLFLGDLPLIYPFIINDPGEGMQAKRRTHAVIVDHLMPPITSADSYGDLDELQQLVDEYYQLEALDPSKLPMLQSRIWEVIKRANLDEDLKLLSRQTHGDHTHSWDPTETEDGTPVSLAEMTGKEFAHLLEDLDGYLCDLTGAQIRYGLYILGEPLEGNTLVDLLVALVRLPNGDVPSLRESVAAAMGLDLTVLLDHPGARFEYASSLAADRPILTHADAIQVVDDVCQQFVHWLHDQGFNLESDLPDDLVPLFTPSVKAVLAFIAERLVPAVQESQQEEIKQILQGLNGRYVPAGPSGAPTRGMAHILPTGRNFYSVDPRALPSRTAWRVGLALADELLERYLSEEGNYPETVGLSIWGTSAMRTHGDDLAQCFALLGVRPCWQPENQQLIGIELIPLEELGRPRIDVLMRISGFFRDAFPHLLAMMDEAVRLVADLDEPIEQNFIRKHVLADLEEQTSGEVQDAKRRATFRIFGSKPGSYGAGILPLIDERNWHDKKDFAEAYIIWGGYAYSGDAYGVEMHATFRHRLAGVQVAAKNQDNREHDIFDSDDYLQYHGGMIASIWALTGKQPCQFFGDSSDPARVRVRDLKEEALRVFRSRVVNPKWLESIQRHGYKGGLEMAATVDYLFGYDATASVVSDWMYQELTEAYVFDEKVQKFLRQSNPWALQAIHERLLEAIDRGLWEAPNPDVAERLRTAYLQTEGLLESRSE